MGLLSNLEFAAWKSYCPRKDDAKAAQSRAFVYAIKGEKVIPTLGIPMSEWIARNLRKDLPNLPFRDYFSENPCLVPIPKSSLIKPGTLWVPKNIASALAAQGLGNLFDCLERVIPVTKAAGSKPAERPKPTDHYNTLSIKSTIERPQKDCTY